MGDQSAIGCAMSHVTHLPPLITRPAQSLQSRIYRQISWDERRNKGFASPGTYTRVLDDETLAELYRTLRT
jgi:hypothetical protein